MKINLIPPAVILYTEKGMTWQAGTAKAFLVRIKAAHAGDAGLLAHELTHVKIFWLVTLVSALLIYLTAPIELLPLALAVKGLAYSFLPAWRLREEVICYRAQSNAYNDGKDRTSIFADLISTRYDLDITKEDARALLL